MTAPTAHELRYGRDGLMPIELMLVELGWTVEHVAARTVVHPPGICPRPSLCGPYPWDEDVIEARRRLIEARKAV